MGLLDRLLGRGGDRNRAAWGSGRPASDWATTQPNRDKDEAAIERYRYLLRTAPPERIEQAHAEAFAKLTPDQRRQVLTQLSEYVPPGERAPSDDPRSLARMATRAEMRQPGTMERALGRGGMGMGGMIAGSLLASVAGAFVGTAIADAMFDFSDSAEGGNAAAEGGDVQDAGDTGGDLGGDLGGGDFGGDFGGGDFGI